MLNPHQNPEDQLKKRARLHMEKESISMQIKTLAQNGFTNFLQFESIVLTRNEKRRLYQIVVREIFDDIVADL
jgi:hypothetical protein